MHDIFNTLLHGRISPISMALLAINYFEPLFPSHAADLGRHLNFKYDFLK